jgi:hypothetical protein
MGLSSGIAAAIAARVAAINGVRGCASTEVDTIPSSPYGSVGLPTYTVSPGSWERQVIRWPVRVFVARVQDEPRVTTSAYDVADGLVVAMRTGVSGGTALAAAGLVAMVVESIDLDRFYSIGGEDYHTVEAVVATTVAHGATYTP